MKKFSFRLERVLAWRQTQARLEEAKLDGLRAERNNLDRHQAVLAASVQEAQNSLMTASSVTSSEFAALEHYRMAAARESARVRQAQLAVDEKIALQMQAVMERRRDAKLLERLRERRLEEWHIAASREVEETAAEAFLGRWVASPLR